jgi:hypothetical protein
MDCLFSVTTCAPTLNPSLAVPILTSAYNTIRQRSGGNTTVLVLEYPQILPATGTLTCPGFGLLNDTELTRLRDLWHQADQLILDTAVGMSSGQILFQVVETENVLAGHELCASDPWAVDLAMSTAYQETAFHPNGPGHAAMAGALVAWPIF